MPNSASRRVSNNEPTRVTFRTVWVSFGPIAIASSRQYFCGAKNLVYCQPYSLVYCKMNYYKISVTTRPDRRDLIIALLSNEAYNGFEEGDFGFKAYIEEGAFVRKNLDDLAEQFDFSYKVRLLPQQNWNAVWESNFKPLILDDFCGIRAEFHVPIHQVEHEIIIQPKMAFGTGHHATTLSVMQLMRNLPIAGQRIFDYGCGTGILSILASKMGAEAIVALDYDPNSYENTQANCERNQIGNVVAHLGELDDLPVDTYDLILANINRNVILKSLPSLFQRVKKTGRVLISGFLDTDRELVEALAESVGFSVEKSRQRDEWLTLQLVA